MFWQVAILKNKNDISYIGVFVYQLRVSPSIHYPGKDFPKYSNRYLMMFYAI